MKKGHTRGPSKLGNLILILLAFVVVISGTFAASYFLSPLVLGVTFIAALLFLILIVIFLLSPEKLSEENFTRIIHRLFDALPLLRGGTNKQEGLNKENENGPYNGTSAHQSDFSRSLPADQHTHHPNIKQPANQRKKQLQGSINSIFLVNVKLTNRSEFYGREREREVLLSRTRRGAPTSIIGPRRLGKTWLIDYMILTAPTKLGLQFHIARIDATLPSCSTVAGFIRRVLEEFDLSTYLSRRNALNLTILERAVREIRSKGKIPVLCIDEFEGFSIHSEFDRDFFTGLRSISQEVGLGLVVASRSPVGDIVSSSIKTSPFFNIFDQIKLKPFTLEEAKEFVEAKSGKAEFTEQEQTRLLRYTKTDEQQWPPLRLQLGGKILLNEKSRDLHYCLPDESSYWQVFEKHLNEEYKVYQEDLGTEWHT